MEKPDFVLPSHDSGDWILRPGMRGFATAVDYLCQLEIFSLALSDATNFQLPPIYSRNGELCSKWMGADFTVTTGHVRSRFRGFIKARLDGVPIVGIKFAFFPGGIPFDGMSGPVDGNRVPALTAMALVRLFGDFYEQQLPGIEAIFSTNAQQWPDIINFSRIVRNAASHLGLATFRTANAPSGMWRGRSIGFDQNGTQVIGGSDGLDTGDLILLLRDLVSFLDFHGVPHSPEDIAQGVSQSIGVGQFYNIH